MSFSKATTNILARHDELRTHLTGPFPLHLLNKEQTIDFARRLLGAGFSPPLVRLLSGISQRTSSRLNEKPIPRHPLRHPTRPFPTKAFHVQKAETLVWMWFSYPALNRLDVMVIASEETDIAIDEVYGFYTTAFSGPQAYVLQVCRLCERTTPRRRGDSTVCVLCRKLGLAARDKVQRDALSHLNQTPS